MTDKIYGLPNCDSSQTPKVGDRVAVRLHPDPENDGTYDPSFFLHTPDGGELFAVGVWKPGDDGVWENGSWGEPEEVAGVVAEVRVKPRSSEYVAQLNDELRAAHEAGNMPEPVWLSITPD